MLIYSYIVTFLLITSILLVLIFIILIINYNVFKDESILDILSNSNNKKSKWLIRLGFMSAFTFMLFIINNGIFKNKIAKEYSNVIKNFNTESDKLIINDSVILEPNKILKKINLFNSIQPNHSGPINRIKVEIIQKGSKHMLIFGRDNIDSLNYHIFDERFPSTSEDAFRMIRTEAFNGF